MHSDDPAGLAEPVLRTIGEYGRTGGPLLVVVGGLHGNEPAGVVAAERVLAALEAHRPPAEGRLLALRGNLSAHRLGCRFLDVDLNRHWSHARLAALSADEAGVGELVEDVEMLGLWRQLRRAFDAAGGTITVLDMHTTSAESAPFSLISDSLPNRDLALALPLTVLLGLEELLDGTMLNLLEDEGIVGLGVEGGRHDAPASVDRLEAVLWLCLAESGVVAKEHLPCLDEARALLARASEGLPSVMEVRYRQELRAGDGFRMRPGYANFQRVSRGEALADNTGGPIRAPEEGRILMPLYQGQGEDGFFIARPVERSWLRLSRHLRRLRLDVLLPLLPGVQRHPEEERALLVDTAVARWFPLELFHLLGYRKRRWEGERLLVTRRPDRLPERGAGARA